MFYSPGGHLTVLAGTLQSWGAPYSPGGHLTVLGDALQSWGAPYSPGVRLTVLGGTLQSWATPLGHTGPLPETGRTSWHQRLPGTNAEKGSNVWIVGIEGTKHKQTLLLIAPSGCVHWEAKQTRPRIEGQAGLSR